MHALLKETSVIEHTCLFGKDFEPIIVYEPLESVIKKLEDAEKSN